MADVDRWVEETMEEVSRVGDDADLFTAEESADFYEDIADQCRTRAQALREEIQLRGDGDDDGD